MSGPPGREEHLVVDADGAVRWTDASAAPRSGVLPDAERRLLEALRTADFFSLAPRHGPDADGGVEESLAWHGAQARTVAVERARVPAFDAAVAGVVALLAPVLAARP